MACYCAIQQFFSHHNNIPVIHKQWLGQQCYQHVVLVILRLEWTQHLKHLVRLASYVRQVLLFKSARLIQHTHVSLCLYVHTHR